MQFVTILFSNTAHTWQLVRPSRPVASFPAAHDLNNKCQNYLWWQRYFTLYWPLGHQVHCVLPHILSVLPLPILKQFNKSLGEPLSRSGCFREEKHFLLLRGFEPQVVQPSFWRQSLLIFRKAQTSNRHATKDLSNVNIFLCPYYRTFAMSI